MKTKITRIDGIEYERKPKQVKYDGHIYIRTEQEDIEKLHIIANKKGIKYSDLIRKIYKEYLVKEGE